jgi:hypothetical protein
MLRFLPIALSGVLLSGCLSSHPLTISQQTNADEAGKRVATNGEAGVNIRRDPRPAGPVTGAVPLYVVAGSCKRGSAAIEGNSYESCIKQEDEAKRRLSAEWKSYPVAARAECSASDGASYVELLTCFEVKDWMKHPDQIGGVTGTTSSQQAREENNPAGATTNPTALDVDQP